MTSADLDKTYDPSVIEQPIYERWERGGWFAPAADGAPYCIMIPPPNVTGSLHMGHAFQDTIMDALIRYHRMRGYRTLWQAGMDHAGIATQMVVERQLESESKSRLDLGRDAFIERVWEWKARSGGTITQQLRRMGASLDWERERFTMDEGLSVAVQEVFVRLYEEGLIYRGQRLVNWDPVLHTAISDLEVAAEEEDGSLWHIRYPLADEPDRHVVVATTRPETMLGDTAVAVHPGDDRYRDLHGRQVTLPLTGRRIPVIVDDYVDPEFGSGCVKITPAHDFNDYEIGMRHGLPLINILTADAAINLPNSPYHGMDRYAARRQIVTDLRDQHLLERTQPHKLVVPRGDRSHAVIEPYLTDQWYVKIAPLAKQAIDAVEDGRIRFVPESWRNTYFDWMHNIRDWCISRQLWWGHRIPAWHDDDGNIFVARSEAEAIGQARAKHGRDVELHQDPDVLDTWFSSALWPFSTLGWPTPTRELKTFYPTNVLVTGFDIIFFWVARMIMMGLKFMDDVPFREVYVHGLIRDAHGQKMSKSKGNILDPLDLVDGIEVDRLVAKRTTGLMQPSMTPKIEQSTRREFPDGIPAFGTDALRFTFASLASTGRNINFDLGRIEGYRNFCNKLWNAARYVLMNTEGQDCGLNGDKLDYSLADRWIIARLQLVEEQVEQAVADYRFDQMANALYAYAWDEFCSWYLELSKVILNSETASAASRRACRHTLIRTLETLLRLLHPIMPFITEEIWQRVAALAGKQGETIMLQPYPRSDPSHIDKDAIDELAWLQDVITGVRNIRGEKNIDPRKRLPVLLQGGDSRDRKYLARNREYLLSIGRFASIDQLNDGQAVPDSAVALVGAMKILVPLGQIIDKSVEVSRLERELERLNRDLLRANSKLDNPNFIDKAPEPVVEKERQRAVDFSLAIDKLRSQLEQIRAMESDHNMS